MATVTVLHPRATQARSLPHQPVLNRFPIKRSRLYRLRAREALGLARAALAAGDTPQASGYLSEASFWRDAAIALEALDRQGGAR